MEDVLKFLLIAGVIIIGLVRQFKKEAEKNADKKPAMPMPDVKPTTAPEGWENTYGGYIPEGPQPEVFIPKKKKEKTSKSSFINSSTTTPSKYEISAPPTIPQPIEKASEFSIQSIEEARRAIIWSEILQRKY